MKTIIQLLSVSISLFVLLVFHPTGDHPKGWHSYNWHRVNLFYSAGILLADGRGVLVREQALR